MNDTRSRFSLVSGEGDGTMLGLAAGDTAGGAWELGYSAITEQATVISYQLISGGRLEREHLVRVLLELDGVDGDEPVYRAESRHFRAWLDGARAGSPSPEPEPSLDAAPRAVPLGVAFRRRPDLLIEQCLLLGGVLHSDPTSIISGVVAAGAVAASCFGQSGRDLILGMAELAGAATEALGRDVGRDLPAHLTALVDRVGITDGERALEAVSGGGDPGPWEMVVAGVLLAAPVADRPHLPVAEAARVGGSHLGAMVGGMLGARVGIRAWPWAFANDTWFAEIGRRLVRGPAQVEDLPIPYAVEQHLIAGERQGLV